MKKYGSSKFIKLLSLLCAAVLTVSLSGCGKKKPNEYSSFAMGSIVTAKLYGDKTGSDALWNNMISEISSLDSRISATLPSSDISRLSQNGSATADAVTRDVLKQAVSVCKICKGTLDITMGAVTELWGFAGDEPRLPADEEIKAALRTKGIDNVIINDAAGTVDIANGQKLDLGAVGKGAACDTAYEVLRSQTGSAVVTVGGSVLMFGQAPDGKAWTAGIRDPFKTANDYFAVLSFSDTTPDRPVFLSTSGSYEKTFEENGKTYHHILDPETGYPVENGLVSVTVKAGSGLNADALSTACFVNGLNADTLGRPKSFGAEAVFVFEDGRVFVTDGLRDNIELTDGGFSVMDDYAAE